MFCYVLHDLMMVNFTVWISLVMINLGEMLTLLKRLFKLG